MEPEWPERSSHGWSGWPEEGEIHEWRGMEYRSGLEKVPGAGGMLDWLDVDSSNPPCEFKLLSLFDMQLASVPVCQCAPSSPMQVACLDGGPRRSTCFLPTGYFLAPRTLSLCPSKGQMYQAYFSLFSISLQILQFAACSPREACGLSVFDRPRK